MQSLAECWNRREIPVFNGVIFGEGSRVSIELERSFVSNGTHVQLNALSFDPDHSWMLGKETNLSALTSLYEVILANGMCAECGGGSSGGDGYIALSSREGELVWALFFDDANPFINFEVRDARLVVVNSHAEIWHVPLDHPENLWVEGSTRDEHAT